MAKWEIIEDNKFKKANGGKSTASRAVTTKNSKNNPKMLSEVTVVEPKTVTKNKPVVQNPNVPVQDATRINQPYYEKKVIVNLNPSGKDDKYDYEKKLMADVDPYLAAQMKLAKNKNITTGLHNGPLDAIRHTGAAAATATNVFSGGFPYLEVPFIPLKILGTNILGAAHEYTAPGKINWKETSSDLYNNFVGSMIGSLPISDSKKQQMVVNSQKSGVLSNINNGEVDFSKFKKTGGKAAASRTVPAKRTAAKAATNAAYATTIDAADDRKDLVLKSLQNVASDADNAFWTKYDKSNETNTYVNDTNKIKLNTGRFTGANVPSTLIDDLASAANKNNIPVGQMLALAGRESTFGIPTKYSNYANKAEYVSGWNVSDQYTPYNLYRFLADKKVPGIKTLKSTHGWGFIPEDKEKIIDYTKTHPELIDEYKSKIAKTLDVGDKNVYDLAAIQLKNKGIQSYNPSDPNYVKMFQKDYDSLKQDKNLMDYLQKKGYDYENVTPQESNQPVVLFPQKPGQSTALPPELKHGGKVSGWEIIDDVPKAEKGLTIKTPFSNLTSTQPVQEKSVIKSIPITVKPQYKSEGDYLNQVYGEDSGVQLPGQSSILRASQDAKPAYDVAKQDYASYKKDFPNQIEEEQEQKTAEQVSQFLKANPSPGGLMDKVNYIKNLSPADRQIIENSYVGTEDYEGAKREYLRNLTATANNNPFSKGFWNYGNINQKAQGVGASAYMDVLGGANDFINPAYWMGNMAPGVVNIPYNLSEGNYGEAAMGLAGPLALAALTPGAKGFSGMANNLLNPLAGIIDANTVKGLGNKVLNNYGREAFTPMLDNVGVEALGASKQLLNPSNPLNLEELRRVYHNAERFLQPEELMFLHKYGYGLRDNYRTNMSNFGWGNSQWNVNNQLPPPPSEIQFMPDGTTRTIYNQQPITDYVSGSYRPDYIDIRRPTQYNRDLLSADYANMVNGYAPGSSFMNYPNLTREEVEQTWRNLNNRVQTAPKPKNPINKSGLTKEEVIEKVSGKDKDAISKMSEVEFENTVLKPTGEIVPYESQADLMPHFTGNNNVSAMSPKEYADAFNERLDLLNDIIAERNKSGIEYRVKGLNEHGTLTFHTPEQTVPKNLTKIELENIKVFEENPIEYLKNKAGLKKVNDVYVLEDGSSFESIDDAIKYVKDYIEEYKKPKIISGESVWSTHLNPGQWRGNVEDIANTEYFRSIPGLEMSNTGRGVFADYTPRKGTGAYESINEYLKKLDLGRVKPGFNSQTEFSRGAWENFIKSGRGVGFYANPKTVYGTMKSLAPFTIGLGAAAALQQKKHGGVIEDPMGQWAHPGSVTRIPSNQITMQGVNYPVLGISDRGHTQMMYPGKDYSFRGRSVTEYPMMQGGGQTSLKNQILNTRLPATNQPTLNLNFNRSTSTTSPLSLQALGEQDYGVSLNKNGLNLSTGLNLGRFSGGLNYGYNQERDRAHNFGANANLGLGKNLNVNADANFDSNKNYQVNAGLKYNFQGGGRYTDWKNKYDLQETSDYNLQRAFELGYVPDETGHLPSVDSETGEWLKSDTHPTRGMEMMESMLNPDVANNLRLIRNEKGKMQYVPKSKYGGEVNFTYAGENHRVYEKVSPTGNGKGIEGHIMVNHPTENKKRWDTIDLTKITNGKVKTVAQGVASTKKWHKENPEYADGGMIKRADGSYSKRGLWDNIRDNAGSGKKPTPEMLKQERKIKSQYANGGKVSNWEIIEDVPQFQKGGKVVSEIWEETTGSPWSEARKLGLTQGGYEENLKLRSELLKNPDKFISIVENNIPVEKRTPTTNTNKPEPAPIRPQSVPTEPTQNPIKPSQFLQKNYTAQQDNTRSNVQNNEKKVITLPVPNKVPISNEEPLTIKTPFGNLVPTNLIQKKPIVNQKLPVIKTPFDNLTPINSNLKNLIPKENPIKGFQYSSPIESTYVANSMSTYKPEKTEDSLIKKTVNKIKNSEFVQDVGDVLRDVNDFEDVKSSFVRGLGKAGILTPNTEEVKPMEVVQPKTTLPTNNKNITPHSYYQGEGVIDSKTGAVMGRYVNIFSNTEGQEYIPTKNVGEWKKDKSTEYNSSQMAHYLLDMDLTTGYQHKNSKNWIKDQIKGIPIVDGSTLKEQWLPVYEKLPNGNVKIYYKTNNELTPKDKVASPLRQYKFGDLDWKSDIKSTWNKSSSAITTKTGYETNLIKSGKNMSGYGQFGGGSFVLISKNPNTGEVVINELAGSLQDVTIQAKAISKLTGQDINEIVLGYYDVGSWSAKPQAKDHKLGFKSYPKKNKNEWESYQGEGTGGGLAFPFKNDGGKTKKSSWQIIEY